MICIRSYFYEIPDFSGIPEIGPSSIEEVWRYVLRMFVQQDVVLVMDLPYLQKNLRLLDSYSNSVSIPAIPAASSLMDETPFKWMQEPNLGKQTAPLRRNSRGNVMIASHRVATVNETPRKIGYKGGMKRPAEDDEWKLPNRRRIPRKHKKGAKNGIPEKLIDIETVPIFASDDQLWAGGDLCPPMIENEKKAEFWELNEAKTEVSNVNFIFSPKRTVPSNSISNSTPNSPFLMLVSPDRSMVSLFPSPFRLDSIPGFPGFPFSPSSLGLTPLRRTAKNSGNSGNSESADPIPAFSEDSPFTLPALPTLPSISTIPSFSVLPSLPTIPSLPSLPTMSILPSENSTNSINSMNGNMEREEAKDEMKEKENLEEGNEGKGKK